MKALLSLNVADKLFANPKRIKLLQEIAVTGSISQGAKLAGISYKSAWDAIHAMNQQLQEPVVHSEKGGKGGGGARLTPFGQRLLKVYEITGKVQNMALQALLDDSVPMHSLLDVMAYFSLKTSARNQLSGYIIAISSQGLNDKITVKLSSGQAISAIITHASCINLKLSINQSILLLFKAPAVTITQTDISQPNINCLQGTLLSINKQQDTSEMVLDMGDNNLIYSLMATPTLKGIKLIQGEHYYACFDMSQAIIASMDEQH